jgi:hypothetical protein
VVLTDAATTVPTAVAVALTPMLPGVFAIARVGTAVKPVPGATTVREAILVFEPLFSVASTAYIPTVSFNTKALAVVF